MSKEIQPAVQLPEYSEHVLTSIDRQLLRQAMTGERSPKALCRAVNNLKSPEWCAIRLDEILEENNWLSVAQEKLLFIQSMRDLVEVARVRFMANEKGSGKVVTDLMNLLGRKIDEANIDIAQVEYKLNHGAAQTMVEVLNLLAERVADNPSLQGLVPKEVIQGAFSEELPVVVENVKQRAL